MPLPRTDYSIKIKHTFRSGLLLGLGCFSGFFSPTVLAQSISYSQAEQSLLTSSFSTQANQALQQSAELQAQAIKGLGLPRVDLNVRAYAFHNELISSRRLKKTT